MRSLRISLVLGFITIAAACVGDLVPAEPDPGSKGPQFKVIKTIPLGGEGEWGYPCLDAEARRLYLPRTTHMQVVDLDKGTLVGDIPNVRVKGSHGVAIASEQKLGFITAGKDNFVAGMQRSKKIEVIKLEDAPLTVRKAIEGRFPGAKVTTTERETENGEVVFEVQLTHKDCKYEMHIKEDGTIEAIEKEIELKEVPEIVLKAVKDKYPDATIQGAMKVDKVKDKKETLDHYLIAVKIGDKKKEITVSLDGNVDK
jgi:hypothetical protein